MVYFNEDVKLPFGEVLDGLSLEKFLKVINKPDLTRSFQLGQKALYRAKLGVNSDINFNVTTC